MLQSKNLHTQNTLKSDSGNLERKEQVTGYREGERLRVRQLCSQDRWGEVWCHQSRNRAAPWACCVHLLGAKGLPSGLYFSVPRNLSERPSMEQAHWKPYHQCH